MRLIFIHIIVLCSLSSYGQMSVDTTEFKLIQPTQNFASYLPPSVAKDSAALVPMPATSIMISSSVSAPKVEYNTTIFCKFEHQLMMSSKLPLKMRLGEVGYVDRLEQKK